MFDLLIDLTGVRETFMDDVVHAGVKNATGVMLMLPMKQEITVYLRREMQAGRFHLTLIGNSVLTFRDRPGP